MNHQSASNTPDQLVTKDQAEHLFRAWDCTEPLPKPSQQTVIAFPPSFEVRTIRVTRSKLKSTYDKALYRVEFDPKDLVVPA